MATTGLSGKTLDASLQFLGDLQEKAIVLVRRGKASCKRMVSNDFKGLGAVRLTIALGGVSYGGSGRRALRFVSD